MAVESLQLVGRGQQLEGVEAALQRLGEKRSALIGISGEPGIGKTALLRALVAMGEAEGHLVLAGRAAEFESEVPFSVFVDALDSYLATLDESRLDRMGVGYRDELAAIFPSLRDAGEPEAVSRAPPRSPRRLEPARWAGLEPRPRSRPRRHALGRPGIAGVLLSLARRPPARRR